jgi:hypothetical protein
MQSDEAQDQGREKKSGCLSLLLLPFKALIAVFTGLIRIAIGLGNWLHGQKLTLPIRQGIKTSLLVVVLVIGGFACGITSLITVLSGEEIAPRPTEDAAQGVATLGVMETSEPTATRTSEPMDTPKPTLTPTKASTPQPTATADTTECILGATYQADVTIPDNTRVEVGERFTKTWLIKNTGTCNWEPGYRLAFSDGDDMGAPDSVPVPYTAPGEDAEVSVELVAPQEPGRCRAEWQMCVNVDNCFGDTVYVQVISELHPTDIPEFTSSETRYATEVAAISSDYSTLLFEFSVLSEAVGEDVSLVWDENWILETATVLVGMSELNDDIRELDAPHRFEAVQVHLLTAARHIDRFVALYADGVDEMDPDKIYQATEEMNLANEAITKANARINELTD